MKIKVAWLSSVHPDHDTPSIFDNDGREIAIHQSQIKELKKLLGRQPTLKRKEVI